jgi:hypothetical protein
VSAGEKERIEASNEYREINPLGSIKESLRTIAMLRGRLSFNRSDAAASAPRGADFYLQQSQLAEPMIDLFDSCPAPGFSFEQPDLAHPQIGLNPNDHGHIDELILINGDEVQVPPHIRAAVAAIVQQRATIQASGYGTANVFGTVGRRDEWVASVSSHPIALTAPHVPPVSPLPPPPVP